MTTTYALIAKYRGQQAVYERHVDDDGNLSVSARFAENLSSYAVAKKVAQTQGFMIVKSWKDAEAHAVEQLEAQQMTPDEPLVWTNYTAATHRAYTADGTYLITRWHMNDDGVWVPGRITRRNVQDWVSTFTDSTGLEEKIEWATPGRHSLGNAKLTCQYHANARLLRK